MYENYFGFITSQDVTPENFLNVLLGNKSAVIGKGTEKVLKRY